MNMIPKTCEEYVLDRLDFYEQRAKNAEDALERFDKEYNILFARIQAAKHLFKIENVGDAGYKISFDAPYSRWEERDYNNLVELFELELPEKKIEHTIENMTENN